jgi:hypothetical protein
VKRARLIAFYLPQFHPIPENDEWWGKGFTEWTNVAKARPLFRGHRQPHLPGELGFYDLRLPESRVAQAQLAMEHGIEGFCYWHYWFAGKRLLDRPFAETLRTGEPDFPFCLAWANETWSGTWHGRPDRILIQQAYPGEADYIAHFRALLPAFNDHRYMTVEGKPIFVVYHPAKLPDAKAFTDCWRRLAEAAGLRGLYFIGFFRGEWVPEEHGFDAVLPHGWPVAPPKLIDKALYRRFGRTSKTLALPLAVKIRLGAPGPRVCQYSTMFDGVYEAPLPGNRYPLVFPNWDNTPRSGVRGYVLQGSTPSLFGGLLGRAIGQVGERDLDHRIVFVKSWNEWAEGNYLEPDTENGRAYLEAARSCVLCNDDADAGTGRAAATRGGDDA